MNLLQKQIQHMNLFHLRGSLAGDVRQWLLQIINATEADKVKIAKEIALKFSDELDVTVILKGTSTAIPWNPGEGKKYLTERLAANSSIIDIQVDAKSSLSE